MFEFSKISVVMLLIFMLLFGGVVMAQDDALILTNTPKAAVDDVTPVPADSPADSPTVDVVPVEDTGFLESITGQILLFATASVIAVGVVLLVMFVAFIRAVVPALKASISPEWQAVLFPILDGAEHALSGVAVDLLKRLEEKAAETETTIDDDVIQRLWDLIAPPAPEAESVVGENRF